jgi:DnaJ family protein A protein 5
MTAESDIVTITPNHIQCHYEVLGVEKDADAATIKKQHRKMALKYHPDKNLGGEDDPEVVAEKFRLVQQAYECLSDPQERSWYDDHRDAILAGWSTTGGGDGTDAAATMLFDVVPFMHPGCYSGYHREMGGFYQVYQQVFERIVSSERKQSESAIELPTDFGWDESDWAHVRDFYQSWESFSSALNFAWEDKFNVHEDAPNRRVRRMMDEENKKARKAAKKTYNTDILQLVAFVKRRDPRIKAKLEEVERLRKEQDMRERQIKMERKIDQQKAKEAWRETAMREMEAAEEEDRLAGRVRLADLEDDYDYGSGKKKKGKKRKNKHQIMEEDEPTGEDKVGLVTEPVASSAATKTEAGDEFDAGVEFDPTTAEEIFHSNLDHDVSDKDDQKGILEKIGPAGMSQGDEDSDESDDEPDIWRCECCRKDFKSEGQMANHMKSKKHKEAFKKYQAHARMQDVECMAQMMEEVELGS